MNSNTKWVIGLIIVIILVIVVFKLDLRFTSRFAILPSGQNNHNSDCSFITNIDPLGTWDYNDYAQEIVGGSLQEKFIAMDLNNDGTKELYGQFGTYGGGTNFCDESLSGTPYLTTSSIGGFKLKNIGDDIYVCSGSAAVTYRKNWNIPNNPYLSCTPVACTPSCVGKCGGVSDGCSGTCNTPCQTSTCLITDVNGNGKMDRDELGNAIQLWVSS